VTDFVLTLSCGDQVGIVHAVARFLAEHGSNIEDSQQYGDHTTGRFFMRVHAIGDADLLREAFAPVAAAFSMTWELRDAGVPGRVLVMVSQQGHCLNDLLYRRSTGGLHAEIPVVVSNHPDFAGLAAAHGSAFEQIDASDKPAAEAQLLALVHEHRIDLVVLARYMQVLSSELLRALPVPAINIHHSFLPSFKGARPYHQAHERGVKLIGATAHYVTAELDEGPIIEQEVARVDHTHTPERLVAVGRDLESMALARAVGWHLDHRVLRNGSRTVVFR